MFIDDEETSRQVRRLRGIRSVQRRRIPSHAEQCFPYPRELSVNQHQIQVSIRLVRISELFTKEALTKCETDIILQFRIDTKSKNMVSGTLLRYMDAAKTGIEYDTLNICTCISSVKIFVM